MWKRLSNRLFFLLFFVLLGVLTQIPLVHSQTTSSEINEKSLTLREERLRTWETLSTAHSNLLNQQEATLTRLSTALTTSENSLQSLTLLYEELLTQNTSLKEFNSQIADRMQQRDMELFFLYQELDAQDKTIERLNERRSFWLRNTFVSSGGFIIMLLVHFLPLLVKLKPKWF